MKKMDVCIVAAIQLFRRITHVRNRMGDKFCFISMINASFVYGILLIVTVYHQSMTKLIQIH